MTGLSIQTNFEGLSVLNPPKCGKARSGIADFRNFDRVLYPPTASRVVPILSGP
jgi:hypothetical protein